MTPNHHYYHHSQKKTKNTKTQITISHLGSILASIKKKYRKYRKYKAQVISRSDNAHFTLFIFIPNVWINFTNNNSFTQFFLDNFFEQKKKQRIISLKMI